jgi:hypothetical protein
MELSSTTLYVLKGKGAERVYFCGQKIAIYCENLTNRVGEMKKRLV